MSFAFPLALFALLAIPLLVSLYGREQRRRAAAADAFAARPLQSSVTPERPGWRRHVPMAILALAAVALVVAAARPQRTVAKPLTDGAIMLVNDVSSSMLSTDVKPSRLGAARAAETRFLREVPSTIEVGLLEFARYPALLQSPTTDHQATENALADFHTGGGTAMGVALGQALHVLQTARAVDGRHPPGAIVLLSDGASNVGISPLVVAKQARSVHVPVDTVSVGTPYGTIPIRHGATTQQAPVPVSRQELAQIAALSGGTAFTAGDTSHLSAVYERLAARLGTTHVKQEITSTFAGAGIVLLVAAAGASLVWFGRLI